MEPETSVFSYLPLFLCLKDQLCLVVGGGEVALRKVQQLIPTGARITVIAPRIIPDLERTLIQAGGIWLSRSYRSPEASNYRLVVATTDDTAVNRRIWEDCRSRGIPVNVVDQPDLCTAIFPSIARRGLITVAIGSGGKAPFLTQHLRRELEAFLRDLEVLDYPDLILEFRRFVRENVQDFKLKRQLYRRFLDSGPRQWSAWSKTSTPVEIWKRWVEETGG